MTPSPLRCAVVGVGYLGRFHAQKYRVLPEVELVGVCDIQRELSKKVADELQVSSFLNYQDLVGKVEAVTVASSTQTHYEIAKYFLENGIHVHVEKPMTATSQQGEHLCQRAEQNGLVLQVGHIERFNPAFLAARDKLNRPLFMECHRLAPFKPRGNDVSVVLDLMIHDLDVILSLVRSEVVGVSAIGAKVLTSEIDIANARLEFNSGAIANITASRVSQKAERKFRVFQGQQYLSLDFGLGEISLLTKNESREAHESPIQIQTWNLEKGDALLAETKAFVEAVKQNKPPVVSGRDGLVALRLAEQIETKIINRLQKVYSS